MGLVDTLIDPKRNGGDQFKTHSQFTLTHIHSYRYFYCDLTHTYIDIDIFIVIPS